MCPACLTSIAITVAATTNAGAAAAALLVRARNAWLGESPRNETALITAEYQSKGTNHEDLEHRVA